MMRVTGAIGALFIAAYTVIMAAGVDFSRHEKAEIPASVRASPGGYRTWSFWHAGPNGGK